jgi:hypothetical protein
MMSEVVFRVQDIRGRGPFKPGFSMKWADEDFSPGLLPLPTFMEEFGHDVIDRLGKPGERFGSAVRSPEQLSRWFSPTEQRRLHDFGYRPVKMVADRILAESTNQVLIARKRPFYRDVSIIFWPMERAP